MLVRDFTNLLMVMGRHAELGNFPRVAEYGVEWVTGLSRIEATPAGTERWTDHVITMGQGILANEVDSWMTGINRDVEGEDTRKIMRYSGGYPAHRERCDAVAAEDYREIMMD